VKASHFSQDIQEILTLLSKHQVRYLIVGGEAVIYYGHARLTGDIDLFYEASSGNVANLYQTLAEFWKGDIPEMDSSEALLEPGIILQFGVPPNRLDLLNTIDGVSFQDAWRNKTTVYIQVADNKVPVYFIGLDDLIRNKESLGRFKDLEDLKYLRKAREQNRSNST
jgi:predicted nucleotidyltransferase